MHLPGAVKPVNRHHRARRQRGNAAIEFGLFAALMSPALVWMFINGMNFIRFNRANDITRSVAMLYIKGVTVTDVGIHAMVERIASGTGMQAVNNLSSPTAIVSNAGQGLITLTRVSYVGTACGCTNAGKYVMQQRVNIGNTSLTINGTSVTSIAGATPSGIWNSTTGLVSNYTTDSRAVVSTALSDLWGTTLADGQLIYIVESWFKSPSFGSGEFDGGGVYSRVFM